MSKVGKRLIAIPQGVSVTKTDNVLEFKGKEAAATLALLPYVNVKIDGNQLVFFAEKDIKQARSNWGTMRALAQNVIIGITQGFKKVLELRGVGYRAIMEGSAVILSVGFSHPVRFEPPAGVKISVEKSTIVVSGIDKALVGQVAARIRAVKKPNPYRGSGIRYKDEVVKTKAGKKVVAGAGAGAAAS